MSPSPKDQVLSGERWLRIDWDPEHSCVYAEWKAFANSGEFRASTTKILDAIRARRADSFVSDNRRLEGIADQDQVWLRDTWVPMAVAAGVKRIAVVLQHHGLGKIASEEVLGQTEMKVFSTRSFTTVSEATEWASGT